eukprot:TRINITY_DN6319_c0_g1_i3.p1 TRINITY_DN6319_c0_g1~~TRINITY_DN6319_c0_g1_i3.p1  ORF type:complete len:698 (-),score=156.25 TRINITY_DN6319_c0_g1_i3:85-2178(-)
MRGSGRPDRSNGGRHSGGPLLDVGRVATCLAVLLAVGADGSFEAVGDYVAMRGSVDSEERRLAVPIVTPPFFRDIDGTFPTFADLDERPNMFMGFLNVPVVENALSYRVSFANKVNMRLSQFKPVEDDLLFFINMSDGLDDDNFSNSITEMPSGASHWQFKIDATCWNYSTTSSTTSTTTTTNETLTFVEFNISDPHVNCSEYVWEGNGTHLCNPNSTTSTSSTTSTTSTSTTSTSTTSTTTTTTTTDDDANNLTDISVPAVWRCDVEATHIMVQTEMPDGEMRERFVKIIDWSGMRAMSAPERITFQDEDPNPGLIGGTVKIQVEGREPRDITKYTVHFWGKDGRYLPDVLAEVPATGYDLEVKIPHRTYVPGTSVMVVVAHTRDGAAQRGDVPDIMWTFADVGAEGPGLDNKETLMAIALLFAAVFGGVWCCGCVYICCNYMNPKKHRRHMIKAAEEPPPPFEGFNEGDRVDYWVQGACKFLPAVVTKRKPHSHYELELVALNEADVSKTVLDAVPIAKLRHTFRDIEAVQVAVAPDVWRDGFMEGSPDDKGLHSVRLLEEYHGKTVLSCIQGHLVCSRFEVGDLAQVPQASGEWKLGRVKRVAPPASGKQFMPSQTCLVVFEFVGETTVSSARLKRPDYQLVGARAMPDAHDLEEWEKVVNNDQSQQAPAPLNPSESQNLMAPANPAVTGGNQV